MKTVMILFLVIAGVLILLISFAGWMFDSKTSDLMNRILSQTDEVPAIDVVKTPESTCLAENTMNDLPSSVRYWLISSGAVSYEHVRSVELTQRAYMKTDPSQKTSMEVNARQVFNVTRPSFVWSADVIMNPFVRLSGRDSFHEGRGQMVIRLFSMIPVVNAGDEKIDQASLQRFLSEIVWFPMAACHDYITWRSIDSSTAEATMNWMGTSGSVLFHFDESGHVVQITADRYMGNGDAASLRKWTVTNREFSTLNGVTVPVRSDVSWDLESGRFTWYELEIVNLKHNIEE